MGLAVLGLALAAHAQGSGAPPSAKPEPQDPLAALAPRISIAGLAGFQSVSTLTFVEEPERPHVLETTYVFPDRARWHYAARAAPPGERKLVYRCGRAFFDLAPLASRSFEIAETAPDEVYAATCWAMEMRRALFLWPDGFEWRDEDEVRTAPTDCGRKLAAVLGAEGRPTAMFLVGEENRRETYRAITWREQAGRWWPQTLDLYLDGARVWTEHVDSVDTRVRVLDLFFVPPDRRATAIAGAVRHVDMVASSRVRLALAPGADWAATAAAWNEAVARYSSPDAKSWKLAAGAWVELDAAGAPRALLVGFEPAPERPAPEGLQLVPEHSAVMLGASGAQVDFSGGLGALKAAAPAGSKLGTPYARFPGAPGPAGPVQIVQPLETLR